MTWKLERMATAGGAVLAALLAWPIGGVDAAQPGAARVSPAPSVRPAARPSVRPAPRPVVRPSPRPAAPNRPAVTRPPVTRPPPLPPTATTRPARPPATARPAAVSDEAVRRRPRPPVDTGPLMPPPTPSPVVLQPPRQTWPAGGPVAAGAALGFMAAGLAVPIAGPAPAPNMCWFYTTPARNVGFWAECP